MSHFRDYLRAELINGLFEKAFLSGKHSRIVAIMAFVFFGLFWILRKIIGGIFSFLTFPWNKESDKTFRSLKEVVIIAVNSGKTLDSIQKNIDWMGDKWHSLSLYNPNGRNRIAGVLFLVHAKLGHMRVFINSQSGELLELHWIDLHKLIGISNNCDLRVTNISEIYQKMQLNLL